MSLSQLKFVNDLRQIGHTFFYIELVPLIVTLEFGEVWNRKKKVDNVELVTTRMGQNIGLTRRAVAIGCYGVMRDIPYEG